jgi:hypothetical protein
VQEEAGGVEHAPLAQAVQPRHGLGVDLPRRDRRGAAEPAQAVRLRLVDRLAQPREVVGIQSGR